MIVVKRFWITYAVAVILEAVIFIGLPFNEDNLILIAEIVLLLAATAVCHRYGKRASFVNLIIMIAYTVPLGYNLIFNSTYGAGFTWWFYLVCVSFIQFLFVVIYTITRIKVNNDK